MNKPSALISIPILIALIPHGFVQGANLNEFKESNCLVINSPGTYAISEIGCLVIKSSDVVLDGQSILLEGNNENYAIYAENVENITVRNFRLHGWKSGIVLQNVRDVRIENVESKNNKEAGILLVAVSSATVVDAKLEKNFAGVVVTDSIENYNSYLNADVFENIESYSEDIHVINSVSNNNSVDGFFFVGCSGVYVERCEANNNAGGIYLFYSSNIHIYNSTANSNEYCGILPDHCGSGEIINNTAKYNAGGIRMDYSTNITVERNTLEGNGADGILLKDSSNNNTVRYNNAINNEHGIRIMRSNNNCIYLNNLINNVINAESDGDSNQWHSHEKITYSYLGNSFSNYLGNYYSDYKGSDENSDGIGDSPYAINSEVDEYPLIQPFENYESCEITKEQIRQQIISLIFQYLNAGEEERQQIRQQIIQLIFEYVSA